MRPQSVCSELFGGDSQSGLWRTRSYILFIETRKCRHGTPHIVVTPVKKHVPPNPIPRHETKSLRHPHAEGIEVSLKVTLVMLATGRVTRDKSNDLAEIAMWGVHVRPATDAIQKFLEFVHPETQAAERMS